jgi:hypothetical protein
MDTKYTSRSLRRHRNTDPVTSKVVRTYHTLVTKTQREAEWARDVLTVG